MVITREIRESSLDAGEICSSCRNKNTDSSRAYRMLTYFKGKIRSGIQVRYRCQACALRDSQTYKLKIWYV